MNALLAIELSPEPCSLALDADGVHERSFAGERGRALLAEIDALCRDAGCARAQLRGIVVGLGPGSYTGLRIACTTARTLGFALGIPVGGIGSFEASGTQLADGENAHIVVDAYRGEFYHACVARDGADVRLLAPPAVQPLDALQECVPEDARIFADERMRARLPRAEAYAPHARGLLQLARARGVRPDGGGFDALADAEPLYLRAAAFRRR